MANSVAIVGSGPAGCYLAQALAKSKAETEITVLDRLCVPYGLVRYGVAPDHQGTKAVSRQFARLFEKQGVTFVGNVEIGRDISLEDLQEDFDAVILATGLYGDRRLGVPGEELEGVFGSGRMTRYWNSHPDSEGDFPEIGNSVAVIGNGNVAIDIVRLLAKSSEDLKESDFDPRRAHNSVKEIHLIGRSSLEQAKFDAVMVKELANLEDVRFSIEDGTELSESEFNPVLEAVKGLLKYDPSNPRILLTFHQNWSVKQFLGAEGRLSGIELKSNAGDQVKTLECDTAVTAIGFDDAGLLKRDRLLEKAEDGSLGVIGDGLFVAGWFKRGPNGTIPENRVDSMGVAECVLSWLGGNGINKPGKKALFARLDNKPTSYADWLVIDAIETSNAASGRCRLKISSRDHMLAVIEQGRKAS